MVPLFFSKSMMWLEKVGKAIKSHPFITLHVLIVLGLVLRLIRLWIEDFQPRDSVFYLENAQIVLTCGWREFYKTGVEAYKNLPPGFFLALQAGSAIGLSMYVTAFIILGSSFLLLMYSVYYGMIALWQKTHYALLGALFAATSPWLLRLGCFILRDAPYFSCGAAALAVGAWAVTREKYRYWLLFALFAFCAIMFRKEGFEFLMVFGVWCAVSLLIQLVRRQWKSVLFSVISGILVAVLTLLPLLLLEQHFRISYGSQWEVIPTTWSGYIWSMFKSLVKA